MDRHPRHTAEPTDGPQAAPLETELPPRLRLLCVGAVEPSWIGLTLQLDAEECLEPQFRWASTGHEALTVLRDESFDCIVIAGGPPDTRGVATRSDPFALVRAIRASGCDDPVVVVALRLDDGDWAEACRTECEVLSTSRLWDSPALVPVVKRAIGRVEQARETRRLDIANRRRLVREREEAEHLLNEQRQIVRELQSLADFGMRPSEPGEAPVPAMPDGSGRSMHRRIGLPAEIHEYYHELLRTYVIMGSGNLGGEIAKLARLIATAGLSPRDTLELHLERVESLVRGLGNRSSRHVMARADLLALELMIHLGECYQRRCRAESR